jgi:hypothetical protein
MVFSVLNTPVEIDKKNRPYFEMVAQGGMDLRSGANFIYCGLIEYGFFGTDSHKSQHA